MKISDIIKRGCNVTLFDKGQGQVEVFEIDATGRHYYYDTCSKKYVQKLLKEAGRDYKKLVSSSPAPRF